MSWDSYIDNLVAQSNDSNGTAHADKVCIIGMEPPSMWTTHAPANSLKLTPDEVAKIVAPFKNKDFSSFMTNGVIAEGVKYQFLREEDGKIVYAKKKGEGALTIEACKIAIVVGHTGEGGQQGNTNKAVTVIANYLRSMNM